MLQPLAHYKDIIWYLLLVLQAVSLGSYTILVHLCEKDGRISFNSTAMNFLVEAFKLAASCFLLFGARLIQWLKTRSQKLHISADHQHPDADLKRSLTDQLESGNNNSEKSRLLENSSDKEQPRTLTTERTESNGAPKSLVNHVKSSLSFGFLALLYVINNNLAVYIQLYMDSTSFQMLGNLRIFTISLFYCLLIGERLSKAKWMSLLLLFLAGIFYSIAYSKSTPTDKIYDAVNPAKQMIGGFYITKTGVILMLILCLISGLSGVYNEYVLKINFADSIIFQNIYLYIYGCIFNAIAYLIETTYIRPASSLSYNLSSTLSLFFSGFSVFTWLIILNQVYNGMFTSVIMKHSSNITRLFIMSCSLIVTAVLSVLIFSLKLNFYFYLVVFTIITALCVYNIPEIPYIVLKKFSWLRRFPSSFRNQIKSPT